MLEIISAKKMSEGEGVRVNRLFPISGARMNHDPFVLFDHFKVAAGQGFPTHPHRGFEAITYLFSGAMRHCDNLGNNSVIMQGGAQIFCAGSGIEHSEMPESEGATTGIQLWFNLAKKLKTIEPSYQSFNADDLPVLSENGIKITYIAGESSPVILHNEANYQFIEMSVNSSHEIRVKEQQGLIYVLNGTLKCEKEIIQQEQAMLFNDEKSTLKLRAESDCRLMLAYGKPHNEPIHQYGPYVD